MSEKIIIRQDRNFHTHIWGTDPQDPESGEIIPVTQLSDLSAYTMMLAGMAICTGSVVIPYARHHDLDLETLEIRLTYQRQESEERESGRYQEWIEEEIFFTGDLDTSERDKLFKISHQCPITRMYQRGVEIKSQHREQSLIPG